MSDTFTRWNHTTGIDDQGEHGLMPHIDGTRDDGATFHIHAFEDGSGGLVISVHGTAGVQIEILEDEENEAGLTFSTFK